MVLSAFAWGVGDVPGATVCVPSLLARGRGASTGSRIPSALMDVVRDLKTSLEIVLISFSHFGVR